METQTLDSPSISPPSSAFTQSYRVCSINFEPFNNIYVEWIYLRVELPNMMNILQRFSFTVNEI